MEDNGTDNSINNGESKEGRNPDGTFQKGFGGRKPGSKNKMREKVSAFIDNNWDSMQEWMDGLEPEKKIKLIIELLPYRMAKLQSIAMTDSEGNDLPNRGIDSRWSEEDVRLYLSLHAKYNAYPTSNGN
jgi:hypothetical protein